MPSRPLAFLRLAARAPSRPSLATLPSLARPTRSFSATTARWKEQDTPKSAADETKKDGDAAADAKDDPVEKLKTKEAEVTDLTVRTQLPRLFASHACPFCILALNSRFRFQESSTVRPSGLYQSPENGGA